MKSKRIILRRRRVRPSHEAVLEARSTRRRRLYFFQSSLVVMLGGVVLLALVVGNNAEPPYLLLGGTLAVAVVFGLAAGRPYRVPYLYVGTLGALPGALVPPFLFVTAASYLTALAGFAWHVIECARTGRDVTDPAPREADAPNPVSGCESECGVPWNRDAKPVTPARLLPGMRRAPWLR